MVGTKRLYINGSMYSLFEEGQFMLGTKRLYIKGWVNNNFCIYVTCSFPCGWIGGESGSCWSSACSIGTLPASEVAASKLPVSGTGAAALLRWFCPAENPAENRTFDPIGSSGFSLRQNRLRFWFSVAGDGQLLTGVLAPAAGLQLAATEWGEFWWSCVQDKSLNFCIKISPKTRWDEKQITRPPMISKKKKENCFR